MRFIDGVVVKSSSDGKQLPTSSELKQHLEPSTRFAFADLLVTILRLDFVKGEDERAM